MMVERKLRYDFVYYPADPDAYRELMDSIGPSIRRSPSLLDKPKQSIISEGAEI